MKRAFSVEIEKCADCPHCVEKSNPGNDGFDGYRVWICRKGAFGKPCFEHNPHDYWDGMRFPPENIPANCPMLKRKKEA